MITIKLEATGWANLNTEPWLTACRSDSSSWWKRQIPVSSFNLEIMVLCMQMLSYTTVVLGFQLSFYRQYITSAKKISSFGFVITAHWVCLVLLFWFAFLTQQKLLVGLPVILLWKKGFCCSQRRWRQKSSPFKFFPNSKVSLAAEETKIYPEINGARPVSKSRASSWGDVATRCCYQYNEGESRTVKGVSQRSCSCRLWQRKSAKWET